MTMQRPGLAAVGAIALVIAGSSAASAESAILRAAVDNCVSKSIAPDARISACTDILRSNLYPHSVDARVLTNRATAYRDKGDTADEIADVKQALAYKSDYDEALDLRDEINRQTPGAIPVTP